jgi:diadenosine tetraphosphatase ApaH/serine/threonine PP2A family protein phosphatase
VVSDVQVSGSPSSVSLDEQVLVTGHTHLQFDRRVAGQRSVNPSSVGLPYHEGEPGTAYWALLGPDVTLRQTRYDIAAALEAGVSCGDPAAGKIAELLMSPPSPRRDHGRDRAWSSPTSRVIPYVDAVRRPEPGDACGWR